MVIPALALDKSLKEGGSFWPIRAVCYYLNKTNVLGDNKELVFASFNEENDFFIALIHPIQWTIAYPVSAGRPAKRQKKTSCVSNGRPVRSTSALARWRVVLPSCLDRVTSWHLFRLARTSAHTFYFSAIFLWILCVLWKDSIFF